MATVTVTVTKPVPLPVPDEIIQQHPHSTGKQVLMNGWYGYAFEVEKGGSAKGSLVFFPNVSPELLSQPRF